MAFWQKTRHFGKIMAFDENHSFHVSVIIYCPYLFVWSRNAAKKRLLSLQKRTWSKWHKTAIWQGHCTQN